MSEGRKVTVLGATGRSVELPGDLFDVQTNVPLIHQVVTAQLAAGRSGTHATKTRGEVSGGGAKPWRQKGTGRARQGSRRAPQWTGGAVVHGPQPRSYAQRTPKKMIAAALAGVLSDRAREDRIVVLASLVPGETPSTKQAQAALAPVAQYRNKLLVLDRDDLVGWLSVRNIPDVHVIAADQLNAYDVVVSDVVVFTTAGLEAFVGMPLAEDAEEPAKAAKSTSKAGPAEALAAADEPVAAEPEKAVKVATKSAKAVTEVADAETPAKPAKKTAKAAKSDAEPTADEQPYGSGSYRGDNPPAGFDVKGNADSMKFHTPESPYYSRTIAEVWFDSAASAEAAGFVSAQGDEGAEEEDK